MQAYSVYIHKDVFKYVYLHCVAWCIYMLAVNDISFGGLYGIYIRFIPWCMLDNAQQKPMKYDFSGIEMK